VYHAVPDTQREERQKRGRLNGRVEDKQDDRKKLGPLPVYSIYALRVFSSLVSDIRKE
jgi:hypothetical protein